MWNDCGYNIHKKEKRSMKGIETIKEVTNCALRYKGG